VSAAYQVEQFHEGNIFGVYLDKRLETIKDYAAAIRSGAIAGLKIPPGRAVFHGDEKPVRPVDLRDGNDRGTRIK
jgi:hypothetical protein